jgi:hypothetical protein
VRVDDLRPDFEEDHRKGFRVSAGLWVTTLVEAPENDSTTGVGKARHALGKIPFIVLIKFSTVFQVMRLLQVYPVSLDSLGPTLHQCQHFRSIVISVQIPQKAILFLSFRVFS